MKSNCLKIAVVVSLALLVSCAKSSSSSSVSKAKLNALGISTKDLANIAGGVDVKNEDAVHVADHLANGSGAFVPLELDDPCVDIEFDDTDFDGNDDHAEVTFNDCVDNEDEFILNGSIEYTETKNPVQIAGALAGWCTDVFNPASLGAADELVSIEYLLQVADTAAPTDISAFNGELEWVGYDAAQLALLHGELFFGNIEMENGDIVDIQAEYCLKVDLTGANETPTGKIEVTLFKQGTTEVIVKIEFFVNANGTVDFDIQDENGDSIGISGSVHTDDSVSLD